MWCHACRRPRPQITREVTHGTRKVSCRKTSVASGPAKAGRRLLVRYCSVRTENAVGHLYPHPLACHTVGWTMKCARHGRSFSARSLRHSSLGPESACALSRAQHATSLLHATSCTVGNINSGSSKACAETLNWTSDAADHKPGVVALCPRTRSARAKPTLRWSIWRAMPTPE